MNKYVFPLAALAILSASVLLSPVVRAQQESTLTFEQADLAGLPARSRPLAAPAAGRRAGIGVR